VIAILANAIAKGQIPSEAAANALNMLALSAEPLERMRDEPRSAASSESNKVFKHILVI
jgi:hypothetical protein